MSFPPQNLSASKNPCFPSFCQFIANFANLFPILCATQIWREKNLAHFYERKNRIFISDSVIQDGFLVITCILIPFVFFLQVEGPGYSVAVSNRLFTDNQ